MGREKREKRRTNPVFFIFCVGKKTEVNYFSKLLNNQGLSPNNIISNPISPDQLNEFAKNHSKKYGKNDQVWVVFDKDNFLKENFNSAVSDKDVKVAWSNPSFELWFLLHFVDWKSRIDNKTLIEKLEENVKSTHKGYKYTKNCNLIFDYLVTLGKRDIAIERASKLNSDYEGYSNYADQNPNTTVHLLVKEILKAQF